MKSAARQSQLGDSWSIAVSAFVFTETPTLFSSLRALLCVAHARYYINTLVSPSDTSSLHRADGPKSQGAVQAAGLGQPLLSTRRPQDDARKTVGLTSSEEHSRLIEVPPDEHRSTASCCCRGS